MKYTASQFLRARVASLLLSTALPLLAADPSGSWTWSTPGRNGGPERVNKLTLKVDDKKLTGKVSAPGRDGADSETPITDAKVEGDDVSFSVVRKTPNGDVAAKYHGKVSADKIEGKVETGRNGEKQSRDWQAKRVVTNK